MVGFIVKFLVGVCNGMLLHVTWSIDIESVANLAKRLLMIKRLNC